MKVIQYRVTFNFDREGGGDGTRVYEVRARDINSGLRKATALAISEYVEVLCVEFWAVVS